mgnify:FL=1
MNPKKEKNTDLADEVIYKLRAVLIAVNQMGLVKANEEFFKWLSGDKTMPFGENNRHIPIRLIDFDNLSNNRYVITNQFRIHHRETKIPDIVFLIKGQHTERLSIYFTERMKLRVLGSTKEKPEQHTERLASLSYSKSRFHILNYPITQSNLSATNAGAYANH